MADLARVKELIEANAAEIDLRDPTAMKDSHYWDQLSFKAFYEKYAKTKLTRDTLELWSRIMFGIEPENMSMLYFIDYMKSGGSLAALRSDRSDGSQALRLKQGIQPISQGLAARLGSGVVQLNSPVATIAQPTPEKASCVVTTKTGIKYEAKRVICTVPTTLYKDIEWLPPLPKKKLDLVDNTEMGYYSKVSATFQILRSTD